MIFRHMCNGIVVAGAVEQGQTLLHKIVTGEVNKPAAAIPQAWGGKLRCFQGTLGCFRKHSVSEGHRGSRGAAMHERVRWLTRVRKAAMLPGIKMLERFRKHSVSVGRR